MDFVTVSTLTFHVLYCFLIISHDRRRILHFNVSRHPTSSWIVQQLPEAFSYDAVPRLLVFDHDAKYGLEVPDCDSIHEDGLRANLYPEPLAERRGRALGGKLPRRVARPR